MRSARALRSSTALLAVLGLLHAPLASAQVVTPDATAATPSVTPLPASSDEVMALASQPSRQRNLPRYAKQALLREKIKYVFVLFQENRSFDGYFGTFPGANGLFSRPPCKTPGFVQRIVNTDGTVGTNPSSTIARTARPRSPRSSRARSR